MEDITTTTTTRERWEEPVTYVGIDLARELATLENENRRLSARVDALLADLSRERNSQIDGSDWRLTEFWQKADELATEAGHCDVYDQLASRLGGPGRNVEVDVTLTYTFTTTLSRSDFNDGDYSSIDPADHVDAYSLRNAEIEVELA